MGGVPGRRTGPRVRRLTPGAAAAARLARHRLSRAERAAGRGGFASDGFASGWTPRVQVEVRVAAASEEIAAALGLDPGATVVVRDRVMFADDQPVQLATSYLPRDLTAGTAIEHPDSGPGGIVASTTS